MEKKRPRPANIESKKKLLQATVPLPDLREAAGGKAEYRLDDAALNQRSVLFQIGGSATAVLAVWASKRSDHGDAIGGSAASFCLHFGKGERDG